MKALQVMSLMPFVPSAGDFDASKRLFEALGFEVLWENDSYAGMRNGDTQFILQSYDNRAFAENLVLRIEVPDLNAWWQSVSAKELPARFPGSNRAPGGAAVGTRSALHRPGRCLLARGRSLSGPIALGMASDRSLECGFGP